MFGRRSLLAAYAASVLPPPVRADEYPTHPITIIVPYAETGLHGTCMRTLQPFLEAQLGARVELAYEPASNGLAGLVTGASAAADGYTLTMLGPMLTTMHWVLSRFYIVPDDFNLIGQISFAPNALIVDDDSPYRSLAELVLAIRARPFELTCGDQDNWASPDIAQLMFLRQAGIAPLRLKSPLIGTARVMAVLSGQLTFGFVELRDAIRHLGGAVRVLAISAPARAGELPTVPTFAEQGYDVTIGTWLALGAPKGTEWPIVRRLSEALRSALANASLQAELGKVGQSASYLDAAAMRQFTLNEDHELAALFAAIGRNVRAPP